MKFTDGYWLTRPGVTTRYATEVADVRADEHRMTLYAPAKHVRGRGDTLNSPLLTVECWSPAEGVIGVRVTHHAGSVRRGPEFALPGAQQGSGKVHRDGRVVELSAVSCRCGWTPHSRGASAWADGAERTVVIPRSDGPGEVARFHLRRRGDRLHVTTDSPHAWQLRFGGPDGTVHARPAGTLEADLAHPA